MTTVVKNNNHWFMSGMSPLNYKCTEGLAKFNRSIKVTRGETPLRLQLLKYLAVQARVLSSACVHRTMEHADDTSKLLA